MEEILDKVIKQLNDVLADIVHKNEELYRYLLEQKTDEQLKDHYMEKHDDFLNEFNWKMDRVGRAGIIDQLCDEQSVEQYEKYIK